MDVSPPSGRWTAAATGLSMRSVELSRHLRRSRIHPTFHLGEDLPEPSQPALHLLKIGIIIAGGLEEDTMRSGMKPVTLVTLSNLDNGSWRTIYPSNISGTTDKSVINIFTTPYGFHLSVLILQFYTESIKTPYERHKSVEQLHFKY